MNVYVDDQLCVEEPNPEARTYAAHARLEMAHVVGDLDTWLTEPTTKIVVVGEPDAARPAGGTAAHRFDDRLFIAKSLPFFLEVAHPGVSKGAALRVRVRPAWDRPGRHGRVRRRGQRRRAARRPPAWEWRWRTPIRRWWSIADWTVPPVGKDGVASFCTCVSRLASMMLDQRADPRRSRRRACGARARRGAADGVDQFLALDGAAARAAEPGRGRPRRAQRRRQGDRRGPPGARRGRAPPRSPRQSELKAAPGRSSEAALAELEAPGRRAHARDPQPPPPLRAAWRHRRGRRGAAGGTAARRSSGSPARPPRPRRPRGPGADRPGGRSARVGQPLPLPAGRPGAARLRAGAVGPRKAARPRLHPGRPAGAREARGDGRHRLLPRGQEPGVRARDRRAVPGRHGRGAAGVAASAATSCDAEQLPLHYVGYSSCFRREAGARRQGHARDLPGAPVRQARAIQLLPARALVGRAGDAPRIEEEIAQELGFHYRVVNIAAGDLGASAARKFDIEVWLPGQEPLPRADVVLELHRLPGPPAGHPIPRRARQDPVRAHAERHRDHLEPHAAWR